MENVLNLLTMLALTTGTAFAQSQDDSGRAQFSAAIQAVDAACATDAQSLCPNAQGPEKGQCLAQNQSSLSSSCQSAISQMPAPPSGGPGGMGQPPQGPPPQGAPDASQSGSERDTASTGATR